MTTPVRPTGLIVDSELGDKTRALAATVGETKAREALGLQKDTFARVAGCLPIRRGTSVYVRQRMSMAGFPMDLIAPGSEASS